MLSTYSYPKYDYHKPPELAEGSARRYPVVIVGAGPVGLTAALDCKRHGIPFVLLDEDDTVSVGSRGIAYAKRTLEILDRCGAGDAVVDKGVTWNVGRTFFGNDEVFSFNLQPDADHHRPGMVNLQQYYLEEILVDECRRQGIELRWKNKVVAVEANDGGVRLQVKTPDGIYTVNTDWVLACDGARSPVRTMLGLEMEGQVFKDRFLIADVVMKAAFPPERWFWFDPPFHRNQSVLLHRTASNVWRIDFQIGWDADPEEERKPERVVPRIRAMLGEEHPFDLEWVSVYTFQCRRMARFTHGRVLFVGDAAHQVSPFGGRGANSGIQDSDNVVWKLRLVMDGRAPARLLNTYSEERGAAADENILNSTRSTDFITPKTASSKTIRRAVLQLSQRHAFARKLVNSGRLSVPSFYDSSSLNTTTTEAPYEGIMGPGAPMEDAPIRMDGQPGWLLEHAGGQFQLLIYCDDPARLDTAPLRSLVDASIPVQALVISPVAARLDGIKLLHDAKGLVAKRYDARHGTAILLRPDQHVAARWSAFDVAKVRAAVERATCND